MDIGRKKATELGSYGSGDKEWQNEPVYGLASIGIDQRRFSGTTCIGVVSGRWRRVWCSSRIAPGQGLLTCFYGYGLMKLVMLREKNQRIDSMRTVT